MFTKQQQEQPDPWLKGWSDNVANLQFQPGCMRLIDVQGNGNFNLVIGETSGRVVSYKGTNIDWETRISSSPITAMTHLYSESQQQAQLPYIAIGSGNCIFLYKVFKAFYKFQLPSLQMEKEELKIWEGFVSKELSIEQFVERLQVVKTSDLEMSPQGLEVLSYVQIGKQLEIASRNMENLWIEDSVTCLDCVRRSDEEYSSGQLLIGSEMRQLYLLNAEMSSVVKGVRLRGVCMSLCVVMMDEQNYRVCALLRENCIQFVRKMESVEEVGIELESKGIEMVRQGRSLLVSKMNNCVSCYNMQGQQEYVIQMGCGIVCIESMEYGRSKSVKGLLVGLRDGVIRLYVDRVLVHSMTMMNGCSHMRFGQFGREDGFLVVVSSSGGLETRILQRQFNVASYVQRSVVRSREQDEQEGQSIPIPKKTKLFIEQAKRERDQAVEIHRQYQYDLMRMRLRTAQTYHSILQNDQLVTQLSQTSQVKVQASLEGLGPSFIINGTIHNLTQSVIYSLFITYKYNHNIFQIINAPHQFTYLIPNSSYHFKINLKNIHPNGSSDTIHFYLFNQNNTILFQASIQIPLSELQNT